MGEIFNFHSFQSVCSLFTVKGNNLIIRKKSINSRCGIVTTRHQLNLRLTHSLSPEKVINRLQPEFNLSRMNIQYMNAHCPMDDSQQAMPPWKMSMTPKVSMIYGKFAKKASHFRIFGPRRKRSPRMKYDRNNNSVRLVGWQDVGQPKSSSVSNSIVEYPFTAIQFRSFFSDLASHPLSVESPHQYMVLKKGRRKERRREKKMFRKYLVKRM